MSLWVVYCNLKQFTYFLSNCLIFDAISFVQNRDIHCITSYLWHWSTCAGVWEERGGELLPPLQHLVPLASGQEVVEEQAVGKGYFVLLKVRMRWGEWQEHWPWKTNRFILEWKHMYILTSSFCLNNLKNWSYYVDHQKRPPEWCKITISMIQISQNRPIKEA